MRAIDHYRIAEDYLAKVTGDHQGVLRVQAAQAHGFLAAVMAYVGSIDIDEYAEWREAKHEYQAVATGVSS